jgi:choline dehydrogenase-like flavoprotein
MKNKNHNIDVVVVGSGPGGAISAALLSEAGLKVMLIERGAHLPLSSCVPFTLDEMTQKYHHGGVTVTLGTPKIGYVEGNCVGGGSEINSGLYHRTPEYLLDEWVDRFGILDLTYEKLLPCFEEIERELTVSYMPKCYIPKASLKLHIGACKLGWKSMEVPRWFNYDTEGTGIKQSMTATFLPRALKAGTQLITNTEVLRLIRSGERWKLVGQTKNDNCINHFEVTAKNVFLCSGTISTAVLLRRNRLSHIAGRQFHLHPSIKLTARFSEEVNNSGMGVPVHQVKEFAPRYSFGCSISSQPYLTLAMLDVEGGRQIVQSNWRHMAIYYAMTTGGMGSIHPLFGFRAPLVRYRLKPFEVNDILDGMVKLAECLFAAGASVIYPSVQGARPLNSMDDVLSLRHEITPERLNLMTIHLFSSCPMGEDRSRCVVDSFGSLHGHSGIYINDASLIPTALGVNPQGTLMALARRNVRNFLKKVNE